MKYRDKRRRHPQVDGNRIFDLRMREGWTQEDLARESGVPAATISRLENNERTPRFSTIRKLADPLGVDFKELLVFPDDPEPNGSS